MEILERREETGVVGSIWSIGQKRSDQRRLQWKNFKVIDYIVYS